MTGPGGPSYRPLADQASPAMAQIRAEAPLRDPWDEPAWDDGPVLRWRGLALFGGLLALESGLFVALSDAPGPNARASVFLAVGVLLAVGAVLVTPAFGGEYVAGALGAAGVAIVLGILVLAGRTFGYPAGTFEVAAIGGMLVFGLSGLVLGLVESTEIERRLDPDDD
jgi:hypothetical protein